ncbi:LacI family DNA-binding transcriptional regulator [Frigidibacter sp. ROC022]|uniref:LacI family DNA-binding transcriptional regulator n=1 Tax=Frigidibacter sp. ROC022 TaxID=2971796 RepID=UPI00215A51B8|nr:substrate-binding domain-containing protein [Frigidibacter sp. ROC022]MCR8723948.1 substrate-binding domain-containing protein [Frigidibacter sp. ROC022]
MNLKELSARLGLSQTTVSRALNGYPEVSEATRKRVESAARRYDYRPNPGAKSLATGKTMAIGHVIPVSTRHEIVNPVFADFIAGAGEVYARNGYDMRLTVVPDDDEDHAYREIAARGSVDGIIVHGPRPDDPRVKLLTEIGLPFVVHGRTSTQDETINWVDVNNRRAFERATNFLLDFGHRRIGLVNGLETMDFAMRRRQGYCRALEARGLALDPELMAAEEMTETSGYRAARRMLAAPAPPTAFLASSIISAAGVRRAITDAGLVMGRDISVVIHDDDLGYMKNGEDEPIYTATRSSVRAAGRLCAELLLDIIAEPGQNPRHLLLDADLVLGRSTGPAPGGAGG